METRQVMPKSVCCEPSTLVMYVLLTFRVGIINQAGVDSIVICDVPAIIANRVGHHSATPCSRLL